MPSIINTSGARSRNKTGELLDTILAGLSIAEKVYGLSTKAEDRDILQKQRQLEADKAAKAEADEKAGVVTPVQQLGLQSKGVEFVGGPEGGVGPLEQGVVRLQTPEGSPLFARARAARRKLTPVQTTDAQGRRVTQFIDPTEGGTFLAPPKERQEPRPRVVERTEIDPSTGRPTTVFREATPGLRLPEQAPTAKEIRRDVRNLVKDTEQHRSALLNIESVEKALKFDLEDYDPETGTVAGEKLDIPGVSVPLIGRVAPTESARMLKDRVARVFNTELKTRSGAAVTDQELERLREEFGQGKFNTEEQLMAALKEYKRLAIEAMQSHEAAFDPLVLEEYSERENALTSQSFIKELQVAEEDGGRLPTPEEAAAELLRRGRTANNGRP